MKQQYERLEMKENDIEQELINHQGNRIFSETLSRSSRETIVTLLVKYISFNRLFGAGVASLSSRLASQSALFQDKRESALSRDRSMDIAANVFAAGIDEFGDTSFKNRVTHRMLAQATMKALATYANYSPHQIETLEKSLDTTRIDRAVLKGYGTEAGNNENELFHALGFHIGSEYLADQEFGILDKQLRSQYPDIITHLENAKVSISGKEIHAYHWIKIHTSVEEDHFQYALQAATLSMQYYSGSQKRAEVKKQILKGVQSFAHFQEEFMKTLS